MMECPECNNKLNNVGKVQLTNHIRNVYYCKVCKWRGTMLKEERKEKAMKQTIALYNALNKGEE